MSELSRSLSKLIKITVNTVFNAMKKKRAQDKAKTAQYNTQTAQIALIRLQTYFENEYYDFADRLKRCVESNYSRLGVACPRHIEDLFCDDLKRVNGMLFDNDTYRNITFSYELKREPINVNITTISSGSFDYVPIEEIERQLKIELPKYRGDFYFNGLSVFPMPDRKVKVVVYDVDRPQKIPYGGYII